MQDANFHQDNIRKILNCDRGSFESFYDFYFKKIFHYVFLTLKNHQDTEHLVEDIFTHAVHMLETFDGTTSLNFWMFSITESALKYHRGLEDGGQLHSTTL